MTADDQADTTSFNDCYPISRAIRSAPSQTGRVYPRPAILSSMRYAPHSGAAGGDAGGWTPRPSPSTRSYLAGISPLLPATAAHTRTHVRLGGTAAFKDSYPISRAIGPSFPKQQEYIPHLQLSPACRWAAPKLCSKLPRDARRSVLSVGECVSGA